MLIGGFETHPAADWFPWMPDQEFDALVDDIKTHGLLVPITRMRLGDKLVIVDGRHRLQACLRAGVEPRWHEYEDTPESVDDFVFSTNMLRRNLNETQRAMVVARRETLKHGGNRRIRDQDANLHLDRAARSKAANVSQRLVATASKILKKSAPELVRAAEQGQLKASAIVKVCGHGREEQAAMARMIEQGHARTVLQAKRRVDEEKRASIPVPDRVDARVLLGDAVEQVQRLACRPHLVVTDPPYGITCHNTRRSPGPHDYADGEAYAFDLLERLCPALLERLDPSAHLYFFSGYSHVWRVKQLLERYFDVQDNPLVWHKGHFTMCDFATRYGNQCEYIWFARMRGSRRLLARAAGDLLSYERVREPTHTAQKPVELLKFLIQQSSVYGETVLDPFCGSGSTGVAALALKRQFIGIEIKDHWVRETRRKLAGATEDAA